MINSFRESACRDFHKLFRIYHPRARSRNLLTSNDYVQSLKAVLKAQDKVYENGRVCSLRLNHIKLERKSRIKFKEASAYLCEVRVITKSSLLLASEDLLNRPLCAIGLC